MLSYVKLPAETKIGQVSGGILWSWLEAICKSSEFEFKIVTHNIAGIYYASQPKIASRKALFSRSEALPLPADAGPTMYVVTARCRTQPLPLRQAQKAALSRTAAPQLGQKPQVITYGTKTVVFGMFCALPS